MERRHLFLSVCLLAAAACGNSTTPPGGVDAPVSGADAGPIDAIESGADARYNDAPPSPYPSQVMAFACAPNDGPGLRLLLTDSVDSTTCRQDGFGGSIEIYLWVSPQSITAPQTITFSPGEPNGSGTHCLGGAAPCLLFNEGHVSFESYEDGVGGTGTYQLIQGDQIEEGSFDATWCDPATPKLCG